MILFIIIDIIILLSEISLLEEEGTNLSLFSYIFKNITDPILIHISIIFCTSLIFLYISYSFGKFQLCRRYIILEGKQTNFFSLLIFCQQLNVISFPISMNIMVMIFGVDNNKKKDFETIIEMYYGEDIANETFYKISSYIPLFLFIVIIFNIFSICGRTFKKNKVTFQIESEKRDKYIREGKEILMQLNKKEINDSEIIT